MLIIIAVLAGAAVVLLYFVAILLREIRFAIHLVSQQLEYLGAPLKVSENGVVYAARRGIDN